MWACQRECLRLLDCQAPVRPRPASSAVPTDSEEVLAAMARKGANDNGRKRSTGSAIRRALGMLAFLPVASRVPMYARLIWTLAVDERVPASRKALLAAAAGYLVVGRDIVPDDVPVLGGLDDLVVVALAIDLFLDGVPNEILSEKLLDLGIERREFEEDVARIRRLMPAPVRRMVRRIPDALVMAGEAVERSGVVPRVRGWIEESRTMIGRGTEELEDARA
jgi:uncharacterized membrane protein YkvA (DUF1232 family)